MHGITGIFTHLAPSAPQATGPNAPSSATGGAFQLATLAKSAASPHAVTASVSSSLGSQTVSTLLQTQDISHGHGGGAGHHGSKTTPGIEAEEAGATEEAVTLRRRKKLSQTTKADDLEETKELDENGMPLTENVDDDARADLG